MRNLTNTPLNLNAFYCYNRKCVIHVIHSFWHWKWHTSAYLSWTHGGFECGETMIEGTENGDHVIGDGLALVKWLLHERRSLSQSVHRFRYLHSDRFSVDQIPKPKRKRKWKCSFDAKILNPFLLLRRVLVSFYSHCVSVLLAKRLRLLWDPSLF